MPPHICFVSDTIHAYFDSGIKSGTGGAERQQYFLATELQNRGYNISIATLEYNSNKYQSVDGLNIHHVIPDTRGVTKAPLKGASTFNGLRKIDADIYYVRGNDFLCIITAAYARLTGNRFVYAVANDSNVQPALLKKRGFIRHPYIFSMKSADCVIAQTNHQRQILNDDHCISSKQIPNGYEIPAESELIPHTEREFVLWVGSIDPDQKKPGRFLDIANQLPEINFVMIGPPDNDNPRYFEYIKKEAASIPNLEFVGYVKPDEIHEYYRKAIALVNTSDYEGFPNVYLEAWRFATPVISLFHSLDDVLENHPVGIHAGSMNQLIETIEELVSNEALLLELGEGGREYMTKNYSLSQMMEKYEEVFENVYIKG